MRVCCGLLLAGLLIACVGSSMASAVATLTVQIPSILSDLFALRSEEEKEEQVRDWLLYAALQALGTPTEHALLDLYATPPVRLSQLAPAASYPCGAARFAVLGEDLVVVVPEGGDARLVENAADEFRLRTTKRPSRVAVFTYTADPANATATLSFGGWQDGERYFEAGTGYGEVTIRTTSDLGGLLSEGFDLTYAAIEPGGALVVGGRRLLDGAILGVDDVATLHQANRQSCQLSLDLRERYSHAEAWVRDLLAEWSIGEAELGGLLAPSAGFSLDPFDAGIYEDLLSVLPAGLAEERWESSCRAFAGGDYVRGIAETILFWEGSEEDLLDLLAGEIEEAYWWWEADRQCARYDGGIEGSETAMTLFYCDLVMKLWGFDYDSSTPTSIGMTSKPYIPIPSTQWQSIWDYPNSRLWLGPAGRDSGTPRGSCS